MLIVNFTFVFALLLLYDTSSCSVCNNTYYSTSHIFANSTDNEAASAHACQRDAYSSQKTQVTCKCEYVIRAPRDHHVELNFTRLLHFPACPYRRNSFPSSSSASYSSALSLSKVSHIRASPKSFSSHSRGRTSTRTLPQSSVETKSPLPTGWGRCSSSPDCMPKLEVTEVEDGTVEDQVLDSLCAQTNSSRTPNVFRSRSSLIKLTYIWTSRQFSGFELTFTFHKNAVCPELAFRCSDGQCLRDPGLLCDGTRHCDGGEDELSCVPAGHPATDATSYFIEVAVIIIVLLLIVGAAVCVTVHYCLSSRVTAPAASPSSHRYSGDSSSTDRHHLHPHPTQSQEAVHLNQGGGDHPERVDLYPISIPISKDGEESYQKSQQQLRGTCIGNPVGGVRPPPNRTIFQCDNTPPPYRSNSVGRLDRAQLLRGRSAASAACCGLDTGCTDSSALSSSPLISRCHSVSSSSASNCDSGSLQPLLAGRAVPVPGRTPLTAKSNHVTDQHGCYHSHHLHSVTHQQPHRGAGAIRPHLTTLSCAISSTSPSLSITSPSAQDDPGSSTLAVSQQAPYVSDLPPTYESVVSDDYAAIQTAALTKCGRRAHSDSDV